MNKYFGPLAALCLLFTGFDFTGASTATAQDQASPTAMPKVLIIHQEFLKPGKAGNPHEKTESAFVQAMVAANSPEHYVAMNSFSGKPQTLFFLDYDSFAAVQKDNDAMMANSSLAQQLDSAQQADGELLTDYDTGVFVYQPDLSVAARADISHLRAMTITAIDIRPGHDEDWKKLAKLHNSVYGNMPNAHWAVYHEVFGPHGGTMYIVLSGIASGAELDQHGPAAEQAWSAVGPDQKKQMNNLESSTFKSIVTNLFIFDPKMSYVSDSWKKADPGFWGQQ